MIFMNKFTGKLLLFFQAQMCNPIDNSFFVLVMGEHEDSYATTFHPIKPEDTESYVYIGEL